MSRLTVAIASLALTMPTAALAQTPVTLEEDVIFSRTLGSAILADIAYPVDGADLPVIIYVHGGRWRGGTRVNDSGLQVTQWASKAIATVSLDMDISLPGLREACHRLPVASGEKGGASA